MRNRTLIIAALLGSLACASDSITGIRHLAAPSGSQPAVSETLTGFVVLYSEGDVRLLTGGIEVQLFGAIEAVTAYGGLYVVLSGRFIAPNHFWVETVRQTDDESRPGEPDK